MKFKKTNTPKTILICNQKGGVGKTYLADELCFMCDEMHIPYTLIDLDGQGGLNHEPIETDNPQLIIMDTPGSLQENLNFWIDMADLIIVPTMLTKSCINPLETMMEILKPWQDNEKKVLVILNCSNRFTSSNDFKEWFFKTYPNQLTYSISDSEIVKQAIEYERSVVDYKKSSKVSIEIQGLRNLVLNLTHL